MTNTPKGKKVEELFAPVRVVKNATINENTRKVMCETGFRRLRKSYNVTGFILTNLMFIY